MGFVVEEEVVVVEEVDIVAGEEAGVPTMRISMEGGMAVGAPIQGAAGRGHTRQTSVSLVGVQSCKVYLSR